MSSETTFRNGSETVRTRHKQLVSISRELIPKNRSNRYEPFRNPVDVWNPNTLRERNRDRAAALLAELEALPERTEEQEAEAAYYRTAWCGGLHE